MPVIQVLEDTSVLTFTVIVEPTAPVERGWTPLADPLQLERRWAPPEQSSNPLQSVRD